MRFFEIANQTRNLRIEKLIEWAKEKTLAESSEFSQECDEYRDFIKKFITNISDIKIGVEYFPITLYARPTSKTIEVNMPSQKVKLVDIDEYGDFDFLIQGRKVKFPRHYEDTDEQLPHFMTTTVFVTAQEVTQFLTMLSLKFAGRWKLIKKEVR